MNKNLKINQRNQKSSIEISLNNNNKLNHQKINNLIEIIHKIHKINHKNNSQKHPNHRLIKKKSDNLLKSLKIYKKIHKIPPKKLTKKVNKKKNKKIKNLNS
jgi:hypothetical protein